MDDEQPRSEADAEVERSGRRAFLGIGATALAATTLASREAGAQGPRRRADIGAVTDRLGQQGQWRSTELRLLRRITMGLTPAEVTRIGQLGFAAYLEEQLNPSSIDDTASEAVIQARYPAFYFTQAQLLAKDSVFWDECSRPIMRAVIERAVTSRRQLEQRMVEFWSDHFNIPLSVPRVVDYRDVIQRHALSTFGDLVRASMRSPAMLIYLDQVWNTKYGINENYARELMELHTVGWDGGYTQADVNNLARVLTGWTMDSNRNFQYRADYHDFTAKTVMGQAFPARTPAGGTAGMDEAMTFAEYLIHHPATARFVSTKLLRWFIRPDPTPAQVTAATTAWTTSGGDIKAVLRAILTPANVAAAPAKLKRPFHYYVSVVRGSGAVIDAWPDPTQWDGVTGHLWDNAHAPFSWQTPDGFPDKADYWAGLMVNRWNAVSSVVGNWSGATPGRYPRFLPTLYTAVPSPAAVVAEIDRRMFGGEMSPPLRTELLAVFGSSTTVNNSQVTLAVHLAACSPEHQYY